MRHTKLLRCSPPIRAFRLKIKYFSPRVVFAERKDLTLPISTKTQIGKTNNLIVQQEEYNLSDLANSCEYLTSEKLCLAVSESEKARSSRQVRCKNNEKMTCCYLCMFVLGLRDTLPIFREYGE